MGDKRIEIPITNIGFELLIGLYGVQPTLADSRGDIKSAPGIEYRTNSIKYNPVNGDGFAKSVGLLKEGQPAVFELYTNKAGLEYIQNLYYETDGYCSLAEKYPTVESEPIADYWYNGHITSFKRSDVTDAEIQYFSFEFTPSGKPELWVEPTGE